MNGMGDQDWERSSVENQKEWQWKRLSLVAFGSFVCSLDWLAGWLLGGCLTVMVLVGFLELQVRVGQSN